MKPLMWSGIFGAAAIVTALAFGADIIATPRPATCNSHDIEHLSNEALRTRIAVQMLRDDMRGLPRSSRLVTTPWQTDVKVEAQ